MKKKLIFSAVLASLALTAAASTMFTGHCGEQAQTVDESFFQNSDDAEEYYQELNVILCGSEGSYSLGN